MADDYTYGSNVTPRHIKVTQRPDGKESIIYGNNRDQNGKITGAHGHTIRDSNGNVEYSRSIGDDKRR